MLRYDVHDSYAFGERRLSGWTLVRLVATEDLSAFHLDLLLPVRSVEVAGRAVAWHREGAHELVVDVPLTAGQSYDVVVRYAGRPGEVSWQGERNWLASGREVVAMLQTGEFQQRAQSLGDRLASGLGELVGHGVDAVRTRGLWAGVDISPELSTGRRICEQLLDHGILAKEAHGQTVRLAPPLVASEDDIDLLVTALHTICSQ